MATARINRTKCNCLAARQAARYITQFYDQYLASVGLRATQHAILAKLTRHGRTSIKELAAELVMDGTTLGRNVRLLERDNLIVIETDHDDRRSKLLRLSKAGEACFQSAHAAWAEAQRRFERTYGNRRAAELRRRLWDIVTSGLVTFDPTSVEKRRMRKAGEPTRREVSGQAAHGSRGLRAVTRARRRD